MFRKTSLGVAVALGLVGLAGYALAASFSVNLTAGGPQPNVFTAALGDTVTFVNSDSATHAVVERRTGLQSPPLGPGQAFEYVLTTSGRLTYRQSGRPEGTGQIVVLRTGTVTLKAGRRSVAYGSGTTLTGTSSLPAFPVKIEQRTQGETRWNDLANVTPASDGSFSLRVQPQVGTRFRAGVFDGELLSPSIEVEVRPVLTLAARPRTLAAGSVLTLTARIRPADAATSMDLTRYDSRLQRWRPVLRRGVSKGKTVFRWRVEYGRSLLRASAAKRSLQPGLSEGSSRPVLVRGTGTAPRKHRKGK